jgi:hypothetical protein
MQKVNKPEKNAKTAKTNKQTNIDKKTKTKRKRTDTEHKTNIVNRNKEMIKEKTGKTKLGKKNNGVIQK